MYVKYFGLDRDPFVLTPDPRFLFLTARHREALASLLFGVTQRKGLMVITGAAGTGAALPFRSDGVDSIAEVSKGVPRVIDIICSAALVNAYGSGRKTLTAIDVLEAATDLRLSKGRKAASLPCEEFTVPRTKGQQVWDPPALGLHTPVGRYPAKRRKRPRILRIGNWFGFAHLESERAKHFRYLRKTGCSSQAKSSAQLRQKLRPSCLRSCLGYPLGQATPKRRASHALTDI